MTMTATDHPITNTSVSSVFASYPAPVKKRLLALRTLILEAAATTNGVREIEGTLKSGQPRYLTAKSKSGTTIRFDQLKSDPARYASIVHCRTNLIETIGELYPCDLTNEGKRVISSTVDHEHRSIFYAIASRWL